MCEIGKMIYNLRHK